VKIVLDTNALETDRYAKRALATQAWQGAAASDFEIVVPEAVILELVKHYLPELKATVEGLAAALKKRGREFDTFGLEAPAEPVVDVSALSEDYETQLRGRCSEPGCRITTPDLTPALSWAVNRRRPFDGNGHGLPDAAVWLTVLELAAQDYVVLVTNNSKDFGAPGHLAPELAKDLKERSIPADRVRIVSGMYDLQREIVAPAAEATARAARILEDPDTGAAVRERLINAVRESAVQLRLGFDLDENPTLAEFVPDGFVIEDARELDSGELLVRLSARGDGLLDMTVWRGEYVNAESDGVVLESFDADVNSFEGELWVSADVTIDAVIRLDGTVEEATIDEFERLPAHDEIQRQLEGEAGERLLDELKSGGASIPHLSAYLPEEPIESSVEEARIETWEPDGSVQLEEISDYDADGVILDLRVDATASITWIVTAPVAGDLDRFGALAEGVEDGGGYLTDLVADEPISMDVTAQMGPGGRWQWVDVNAAYLKPAVRSRRAGDPTLFDFEHGDLVRPDEDDEPGG
jgi:PIN domain